MQVQQDARVNNKTEFEKEIQWKQYFAIWIDENI